MVGLPSAAGLKTAAAARRSGLEIPTVICRGGLEIPPTVMWRPPAPTRYNLAIIYYNLPNTHYDLANLAIIRYNLAIAHYDHFL